MFDPPQTTQKWLQYLVKKWQLPIKELSIALDWPQENFEKYLYEIPLTDRKLGDLVDKANLARKQFMIDSVAEVYRDRFVITEEEITQIRSIIAKRIEARKASNKSRQPKTGIQAFLTEQIVTGKTLFVGRQSQLATMSSWLQQSITENYGQIGVITGESGFGKSALVSKFVEDTKGLFSNLIVATGYTSESGHRAFDQICSELDFPQYSPNTNTTYSQHVINHVLKISESKPLLLVAEDLHWSDQATIELLDHFIDELGLRIKKKTSSSILLVITYRQSDIHKLPSQQAKAFDRTVRKLKSHFGFFIHLDELEDSAKKQFVDAFLEVSGYRENVEFQQRFFSRTQGYPLFVEQLINLLQQKGAFRRDQENRWVQQLEVDWSLLPERVESTILSRIELIREENELLYTILKIAAVEGETFTATVIAGVLNQSVGSIEELLVNDLDNRYRLVEWKGDSQIGLLKFGKFCFRHQVIREVIYQQLKGLHTSFHDKLLFVLEKLYQGYETEKSEELAYQYMRCSGRSDANGSVTHYLLNAARSARTRYANGLASEYLGKASETVKSITDEHQRTLLERDIYTEFGSVLAITQGLAAEEAINGFRRALLLYDEQGKVRESTVIQAFITVQLITRGEFAKAIEGAKKYRESIQHLSLEQEDFLSEYLTAPPKFFSGQLKDPDLLEHFERGIKLFNPGKPHPLYYLQRLDPGLALKSYHHLVLWSLGHIEQALDVCDETCQIANNARTSDLFGSYVLVFPYCMAAVQFQLRNEAERVLHCTEIVLKTAKEHEAVQWLIHGKIMKGWAQVHVGDVLNGIENLTHGINEWRGIGAKAGLPYYWALLIDSYFKSGQFQQGLDVTSEAMREMENLEERWFTSEILRLRGELLSAMGYPKNKVQEWFDKALLDAQDQGAISLELRAIESIRSLRFI